MICSMRNCWPAIPGSGPTKCADAVDGRNEGIVLNMQELNYLEEVR